MDTNEISRGGGNMNLAAIRNAESPGYDALEARCYGLRSTAGRLNMWLQMVRHGSALGSRAADALWEQGDGDEILTGSIRAISEDSALAAAVLQHRRHMPPSMIEAALAAHCRCPACGAGLANDGSCCDRCGWVR